MAEPTYKELYEKQMRIEQAQDPEVIFLADTLEEDVDWLQREGRE